MKQKEHSEPALQEVHEWREKVFKEIEGKSPKEKAEHINEKAAKARREFENKQKRSKVI